MVSARKWSVVNQKGGVGKTTTAVNLSTAFAAMGEKVLLIDLDPQGNATTSFGLMSSEREKTIYNAMIDAENTLSGYIIDTYIPGLSLLPGSIDLSGVDIELYDKENKLYILDAKLKTIEEQYDFIIMDCPPSLGFITVNAMCASNGILVPLQCEFFALEGLSQLLHTVEKIQGNLNPNLEVEGIILTMFDQRNRLSAQVSEDVRSYLGTMVYNTIVPRNVRLSEAPSYGKPALIYDLNCNGSQAYLRLAKEIKARIAAEIIA
ncbi:MAG: AAA family ATPase [Pseudomonadota bacterium]